MARLCLQLVWNPLNKNEYNVSDHRADYVNQMDMTLLTTVQFFQIIGIIH